MDGAPVRGRVRHGRQPPRQRRPVRLATRRGGAAVAAVTGRPAAEDPRPHRTGPDLSARARAGAGPTPLGGPADGAGSVTLGDLLGAVAASVSRAGAIADDAALTLARSYLNDDALRAVPVPRPSIADLEVTFTVSVLGTSAMRPPLDDAMAGRVSADLGAFARGLPDDRAFAGLFAGGGAAAQAWQAQAPGLDRAVGEALTRGRGRRAEDAVPDVFAAFASALARAVEATPPARRGWLRRLVDRLPGVGRRPARIDRSLLDRLDGALHLIVAAGAASSAAERADAVPDLRLAVAAKDLAGLGPDRLQKIVVRCSADPRRGMEVALDGGPPQRLGAGRSAPASPPAPAPAPGDASAPAPAVTPAATPEPVPSPAPAR